MGIQKLIPIAVSLAFLAASTGQLPRVIKTVRIAQLQLIKDSQGFLNYVLQNNTFFEYSKIEGIEKVLKHLSYRINHGVFLNESLPLFLESEKTIIIENPSLDLLSSVSNAPGVNLIAWFGKKLEKISLPTPPWRVSEFTAYESKILYTFLDNFLAKRLPLVLLNLKALEKEGAPFELVLGALNRQVDDLTHW